MKFSLSIQVALIACKLSSANITAHACEHLHAPRELFHGSLCQSLLVLVLLIERSRVSLLLGGNLMVDRAFPTILLYIGLVCISEFMVSPYVVVDEFQALRAWLKVVCFARCHRPWVT